MNTIYIVSMGPGADDLIAPRAVEVIKSANKVFCADRYAREVPEEKLRPLTPLGKALDEIAASNIKGEKVAVLASGDAGLYGILDLLSRTFGRDSLSVIPGISSLSAFCAALGISRQNAKILSAHGRELSEAALCHYARTNRQTLLLTDARRDPNWVKRALSGGGLEEIRLTVGERVSYPDEFIGAYEQRTYDPLSVVLMENDSPEDANAPFGIADECFIRGKTPMTKREIRVQIISELRLKADSLVWDIGAGTGSVSIECAKLCPLGTVYAIERDADAVELVRKNMAAFHALNVIPVHASAPEALKNLPAPTHVFIGGSGGETKSIIELIKSLKTPVRVCASAVTVETEAELIKLASAYPGFTAAQIQVSRIEKLGAYNMRRANNPVTVCAFDLKGE